MRYLIVASIFASCCLLSCSGSTGPKNELTSQEPIVEFGYDSGGENHIFGNGAWILTITREGAMTVQNRLLGDVRDFDPCQLTPDETAHVWALIDRGEFNRITPPSSRSGYDDEIVLTFDLTRGTTTERIQVWANDTHDFPVIDELLQCLYELVHTHTGERPALR